jgi:hypothetical protein
MFLVRLQPYIREAVGSGDHKTTTAMIRATDALWDAVTPTVLYVFWHCGVYSTTEFDLVISTWIMQQ